MGFLFSSNSGYLGVDVGTTGIKIVELKKDGGVVKLLTYGFSEKLAIKDQLNIAGVAKLINQICAKAGVVSKNAVAALPTFSVFSSIINLAGVGKKDLNSAVSWEAKKVIPLPLEEMVLDWKILGGGNGGNTKVLLTGAPKSLIKRYIEIFKSAQINLLSLETETFALVRSLIGNDKASIMLVEMGANTTDISIIDQGVPILNRSIDVGGFTITKAIGNNLNIGLERAEQFKYDLGISSLDAQEDIIPKTVIETISIVINEIKYSLSLFQSKNNKSVEKIILSGGSALLINFSSYLSKILNMNVIIGNPWSRVACPLDLKMVLDEIGPRMSVAVGLAMREIE